MPISLQSLREFQSTNMIWDDRKGVMKSAGLWQKFKTYFNIGHAREQNAATLEAIKDAIVATFPSDDLKALAEKKINQVRTDHLIGAAEIKGILAEFEHIGGGSEAAIKERTVMHMAATRKLPMKLWCAASEITAFVSNHIARDPSVQRDPRSADIKGMTETLIRQISDLADTLQGDRPVLDEKLLRTVVKNLEGVAWKTDPAGNSVARPDANSRMEAIRRYWEAAENRARDEFNSPMVMHRALELLDNLLQLPDPYDRLATLIRTVPLEHLEKRDFGAILTHLNSLYDQTPANAGGPMLTEADILPSEDDGFAAI